MSKKEVFKTLKYLLLKLFIMSMGLKLCFVLSSYGITFVMDLVNDRIKLLDPKDKIGNEGIINTIVFLFLGLAFFSSVRSNYFLFCFVHLKLNYHYSVFRYFYELDNREE
jgi:hypothetical protein